MLKFQRLSPLLRLALVFAVIAAAVTVATAQIKKGRTRPPSTNPMLLELANPSGTAPKNCREAHPASDEARPELALRAAVGKANEAKD